MLKWILVLWPSFLIAAVTEAVFFIVIDPKALYLFGEQVHYSAVATYSIGFLGFWLVCAASSLTTLFLLRPGSDINRSSTLP